jgi:hypothetical protein
MAVKKATTLAEATAGNTEDFEHKFAHANSAIARLRSKNPELVRVVLQRMFEANEDAASVDKWAQDGFVSSGRPPTHRNRGKILSLVGSLGYNLERKKGS